MPLSSLTASGLAALAAGCLAYVFVYPLLSGEKRAEKRQKALVGEGTEGLRTTRGPTNRRDQVAQSLKDIEKREKARHKVSIEARITQAGLTWSKKRFFIVSGIAALVVAVLLFALTGNPFLAAVGVFIGGLGLPRWYLNFVKKRRLKRFITELPNAIDVIVRGIRAGLPLGDCLRIVARESQEPVRSEFKAMMEAQSLGIPVGEAVMKLYERAPVPEANFFAIVISIQSKSGGNLSEALGNLSRVLRERKKMAGKIAAMSTEATASAAIIAALPFIVALLTYLSSPEYIQLLWTTMVGKITLVLAAVWMMTGIFVMKRMINFDF